MPLIPSLSDDEIEIPPRGIIAMAVNGVPVYGPMESDSNNAVEPEQGQIPDAQFWYGHSTKNNVWHIHHP